MTGLVWLHISDIHFQKKGGWREVPARTSLLSFLSSKFRSGEMTLPHLIFCTGDIAFGEVGNAAMTTQYEQAEEFFNDLRQCCGGLARERVFFVPGNHDVNRKKINRHAQEELINKSRDARRHESAINQEFDEKDFSYRQNMERLADYGEFIKRVAPHQYDAESHVYTSLLEIDGVSVGVAGFNSAWSCAGDEDDRHLWLAGQWQFNKAKAALKNAQLRIGLIHHPIDWLNQAEQDLAGRRIDSGFNFWLNGHKHNSWVEEGRCIKVSAGAVGAMQEDEFGINSVEFDSQTGAANIKLFTYKPRDDYWAKHVMPPKAPDGIWPVTVDGYDRPPAPAPESAKRSLAEPAFSLENRSAATGKLYGRDKLLASVNEELKSKSVLVLYGMRGNGKTSFIRRLATEPSLQGKELFRITAGVGYDADYLFRQLVPLLRDTTEQPVAPTGDVPAMAGQLASRYQNVQPACIWIDMAHQWFNANGWRDPSLGKLFSALRQAFGARWRWIFELRERPSPTVFAANCCQVELPGLDRPTLSHWLSDVAPSGSEAEWTYSGNKLLQLYQWLGGGQGEQAHPQAIQLMIEVAKGLGVTPLDVRQRYINAAEERVEDYLLRDLFDSVLSPVERDLLSALALYRDEIPHDHADLLEEKLSVLGAWDGLDKRCLLPSDASQGNYYLHGFISAWLRGRMGYGDSSSDEELVYVKSVSDAQIAKLQSLHGTIAECWLNQLGHSSRVTHPNVRRALEAFHHLLSAGDIHGMDRIAHKLLSGTSRWTIERLWSHDEKLRQSRASATQRVQVLRLITKLDPRDHMAWRFLGERLQKEGSGAPEEVLSAFENAHKLRPDFPPYFANLGKALLLQGKHGAEDFLRRLAEARELYPTAVDAIVQSIEADCLAVIGDVAGASVLRQARIRERAGNPAFYTAEASYQLQSGNFDGALYYLDLAVSHGNADSYTEFTRAEVLEAKGEKVAASALRNLWIDRGDASVTFYNSEADYQIEIGNLKKAGAIIDLAVQRGCANGYTESARYRLLDARGRSDEASMLRQERIMSGERNTFLYNSEADYQFGLGNFAATRDLLDRAAELGCSDHYSGAIRDKLSGKVD